MILRYMAAHIRNCTGNVTVSLWPEQDIVDSFAMLPEPANGYQQWLALVSDQEPEQAANKPAGRAALMSDISSLGNIVKIGA